MSFYRQYRWVGVAEPPPDNGITAPQGGSAYMAIDQTLVGRILAGCSNQSAPGEDRMGAEIVKLLWSWDPERITNYAYRSAPTPEAGRQPKGSSFRSQVSRITAKYGPTEL